MWKQPDHAVWGQPSACFLSSPVNPPFAFQKVPGGGESPECINAGLGIGSQPSARQDRGDQLSSELQLCCQLYQLALLRTTGTLVFSIE